MTVTSLSHKKIEQLIKAGKDFNIPFHLPPFDGNIEEGSFDIHDIKNTKKFDEFLGIINKLGVKYEYAFSKKDKKRIFMAIKMKQ